ncbi:MAG: SRPBCC domain-containing protein [Planctomycetota bacterium]
MAPGLVRLERRFDAPPKSVFRAWCVPEDLRVWIWGSLANNVRAEADARVGGAWRVSTLGRDGSRWEISGAYQLLDLPNRLVATLTWNAPVGYEPGEERIGVELHDEGDRTLMVFTHDGIPDAKSRVAHVEGWSDSFEYLHRLLEPLP